VWAPLPEWVRGVAAARPGSVLLETARDSLKNQHSLENQQSYLFLDPVRLLVANALEEIPRVFAEVERALAAGLHVAGFFAYECGYHFEPSTWEPSTRIDLVPVGYPLIWLGVYERPVVFDHAEGRFSGADGLASFSAEVASDSGTVVDSVGPLALEIGVDEYCVRVQRILEWIDAGDTYQVNFTDRVRFETGLSAAETFAVLSAQQPVAHSAFLNLGKTQILSFSPELFFRAQHGRIVTRPMKGTMPRGLDSAEDELAAVRLRNDEKNRSEHVMIVDLLRSDLGRICEMGSVAVEDLFTVERYETLLQMTSTVSGRLQEGIGWYEVFRGMFPSGSITGAPKVRTMQIIGELETEARGVYTGAIGYFAPGGMAAFNVAIRTLVMEGGRATLGVGGGIVADSEPLEEYRECLLKASFLTRRQHKFELIETMLWDGEIRLLGLHLERLEASALYFGFAFGRGVIEERLRRLTASWKLGERYRVRLLLARSGEVTVAAREFLAEAPRGLVRISAERTSSVDVFYRHKTTRRELYDAQYAVARAAGLDDVLFLNERGEVTEGAISNVFVERAGKLMTPPLACGVLNGVYRRHLLESRGDVEERVLSVADIESAEAIYLCNALRGLYRVRLQAG
jgi:para-aminobenzoate synthetase/4-amino-4-deoxychorismate lyase